MEIHHIDTSVILEPNDTEDGHHCYKYRNLIGYKYLGKISLISLGELFDFVLRLKTYRQRLDSLDFIFDFIARGNVEVGISRQGADSTSNEIGNINYLISPADRMILATAIVDKADVLVTIDSKLVHNTFLERKFGIRILHPVDLL